ncbi:MAG TPA: hypothetical protein VGI73_13500 [Solirubrobacterales bacterium]|jgi:hypothetical protein
MSDRHQDLELAAAPEEAREIVREAVAELGWKCLDDEDGGLVVRESPRLLLGRWPVGIKVSIADAGGKRSALELWGRMGGFGPFIAEQLKERMEEFASLLHRQAAAHSASSA